MHIYIYIYMYVYVYVHVCICVSLLCPLAQIRGLPYRALSYALSDLGLESAGWGWGTKTPRPNSFLKVRQPNI